jgi:hypothetical protein
VSLLSSFRSKRRDIATDVARLTPILDTVQVAVREAESELGGLRLRLEESGDRAAFLFGDGMESEADADPRDKAALKELEGFLARGGIRRRYLERQVATFREIIAVLTAAINPRTPMTDRH